MRYIAFDVETPNRDNNRMSAIGISVVENKMIVDRFYSLVNPEQRFDSFNIELTHITPAQAYEAPTFSELWPIIEPIMKSGLLVAHNAMFDMSVLSKCLLAYDIDWISKTEYCCTCQMGKKCLPNLENHRLDTMCRHLGLGLDHHNALSDANACAELLIYYLEHGFDPKKHTRPYDMLHSKTIKY